MLNSIESAKNYISRNSKNIARATLVPVALIGASIALEATAPVSAEKPSAAKPEVTRSLTSKFSRLLNIDPESALASALECANDFVLRIHAPKDDPKKNIVGTRVEVYNPTNPGEKVVYVATEQQDFNGNGDYSVNSIIEGSANVRSAVLRGLPTGERFCDQNATTCNNISTIIEGNRRKVKTTKVAGRQIDEAGKPYKDYSSELTVDCPRDEVCPSKGDWADDVEKPAPTIEPTLAPTFTPTPAPTQPPCVNSGQALERC